MILSALHDPMGSAILEYQKTGDAARLRVLSSQFEEDEIPVPHLFRGIEEMPDLERAALDLAKGRVLDVGAGAGCHSIILQSRGLDVTSVDISPLSCEAMKLRGLRDVQCLDILEDGRARDSGHAVRSGEDGQARDSGHAVRSEEDGRAWHHGYDTILMLMNGTGIAGTVEGLAPMLKTVSGLLAPGGSILIDSSDLQYLYRNDDGSIDIDLCGAYYGEVDYRMVYRNVKGKPFNWLYADFSLLHSAALKCGLSCEMVSEGEHYDYLARIY